MPTNYDLWKVKVLKNPQGMRHRYWAPVMVDGDDSRRELTFAEWPFPRIDLEIDEEITADKIVKRRTSNRAKENDLIIIDKTRGFDVAHYIARDDLFGGKLYLCRTDGDDASGNEKWQRILFSRDESSHTHQRRKYYKSDWEGKKGDLLIRCETRLENYKKITYTYVIGEGTVAGMVLNSPGYPSGWLFDIAAKEDRVSARREQFKEKFVSAINAINSLDATKAEEKEILARLNNLLSLVKDEMQQSWPDAASGTVSALDLISKFQKVFHIDEIEGMEFAQFGLESIASAKEFFKTLKTLGEIYATLGDNKKTGPEKSAARSKLGTTLAELMTNFGNSAEGFAGLGDQFYQLLYKVPESVLGVISDLTGVLTSAFSMVRYERKALRTNDKIKTIEDLKKLNSSENVKPLLDYVLPKLNRRSRKMWFLTASSGIGAYSSGLTIGAAVTGAAVLSTVAAVTGIFGIIGAGAITVYTLARWSTKKKRHEELAAKNIPNSPEAFARSLIELYKSTKADPALAEDNRFCISMLRVFKIDETTLGSENNDNVAVEAIVRHLTK